MEKRFWAKVNKSGGVDSCWLWQAGKFRSGYGTFNVDGKTRYAHRVSWGLMNGHIPEGLCVLHRCDVPACVNPGHLFLGSNAENVADREAKGRGVVPHLRGEACVKSKLTAEQVGEIRDAGGTQRAIAARFGISQAQVWNIRAGRQWAHLVTP